MVTACNMTWENSKCHSARNTTIAREYCWCHTVSVKPNLVRIFCFSLQHWEVKQYFSFLLNTICPSLYSNRCLYLLWMRFFPCKSQDKAKSLQLTASEHKAILSSIRRQFHHRDGRVIINVRVYQCIQDETGKKTERVCRRKKVEEQSDTARYIGTDR